MLTLKNLNFDEEVKKVKAMTSKQRAGDYKHLLNYVEDFESKDMANKLVERIKAVGISVPDRNKYDDLDWVDSRISNMGFLVMVRDFGWDEKKLIEMAKRAVVMEPIDKFFIRYFASVKMVLGKVSKHLRHHYSEGDFQLSSFDKNKREAHLKLKNFKANIFLFIYISGIYITMVKLTSGSKNVKVEVDQCADVKDGSCHEYKITW